MKKSNKKWHQLDFVVGDLYLFHKTDKQCSSSNSLWGIYSSIEDGIIYLESSTLNLRTFRLWHRLPNKYRYSRRATRKELRNYMYNMGCYDILKHY